MYENTGTPTPAFGSSAIKEDRRGTLNTPPVHSTRYRYNPEHRMTHNFGDYAMPENFVRPVEKNGFGTTALVLGIVGVVFSFIPIVGMVAWPMVILGLIFGILGIRRVGKGVATNKGAAIAGTVLSAIGLVICVVWAAAFGSAAESLPAAPTSPSFTSLPTAQTGAGTTVPALPDGSYGDGMYEVGAELPAGTYKTAGPSSDSALASCYWAKYSDATGSFEALTSNDIVEGRSTVTIKPGGYMEFSGGCSWTKQ